MARKKSDYVILFEELYKLYTTNGDNDATWSLIFSKTRTFIHKLINKSSLYAEHFSEGEQNIMISMMEAFRTYDITKGSSLFTWVFMLAKQAIFKTIKEQTKFVNCNYLEEIDLDFSDENRDPEEQMMDNQFLSKECEIRRKLAKLFGGPLEAEIFILKNGIFDYGKMSIDEIVEETRLSKRTIYQVNYKINKIIKKLRTDEEMLKQIIQ